MSEQNNNTLNNNMLEIFSEAVVIDAPDYFVFTSGIYSMYDFVNCYHKGGPKIPICAFLACTVLGLNLGEIQNEGGV